MTSPAAQSPMPFFDSSAGSTHLSASTDQQWAFQLRGDHRWRILARHRIARAPPSNYASRLQLPDSRPAAIVLGSTGTISFSAAEQREGSGGERLSSKEVSGLPLNKRDFSQLLLLAAGTMTDTNGAANFTQQFAINGQRGTAAVFAMDGADISDPEMGGGTFTNFNVDAVAGDPVELRLDARRDRTRRAGLHRYHHALRHQRSCTARPSSSCAMPRSTRATSSTAARLPQPAPYPAASSRNEFGLTNGGPVVIPGVYDGRNKTYYFGQYQGFRQVLGTTQVLSVPTAAERAGQDTTAFPGDTLIVPVDPKSRNCLRAIRCRTTRRAPFGARTYATSSKVKTVTDQFSARIDHDLGDKSQALLARSASTTSPAPRRIPARPRWTPRFAVEFFDQQRNAAFSTTRSPSPNFTCETSVGFTRTTPNFPTMNHTDPALNFGDSLYEPSTAAAGSVSGCVRQSVPGAPELHVDARQAHC